jgi:hypothetical protein
VDSEGGDFTDITRGPLRSSNTSECLPALRVSAV